MSVYPQALTLLSSACEGPRAWRAIVFSLLLDFRQVLQHFGHVLMEPLRLLSDIIATRALLERQQQVANHDHRRLARFQRTVTRHVISFKAVLTQCARNPGRWSPESPKRWAGTMSSIDEDGSFRQLAKDEPSAPATASLAIEGAADGALALPPPLSSARV